MRSRLFFPKHPRFVRSKKERGGGGREKGGGAQTQTHRLETSLFGAVTRTDWAAAVWVKENIIVGVVFVCVLKSEDFYT